MSRGGEDGWWEHRMRRARRGLPGSMRIDNGQMFEQVRASSKVTALEIDLSTMYINLGQRDKRAGHGLGEVAVILTLENSECSSEGISQTPGAP